MAQITLKGNPVNTSGTLPQKGDKAPDFQLVGVELNDLSLSDFKGSKLVLNIFPSIDTGVCAQSTKTFNEKASSLTNTKVLCISRDLPFALSRFCGAEGLENVISLSDFREKVLGKNYGVEIVDSPLKGLLARAVVVIDEEGTVLYSELVPEIGQEPNYEAALSTVS